MSVVGDFQKYGHWLFNESGVLQNVSKGGAASWEYDDFMDFKIQMWTEFIETPGNEQKKMASDEFNKFMADKIITEITQAKWNSWRSSVGFYQGLTKKEWNGAKGRGQQFFINGAPKTAKCGMFNTTVCKMLLNHFNKLFDTEPQAGGSKAKKKGRKKKRKTNKMRKKRKTKRRRKTNRQRKKRRRTKKRRTRKRR